MAVEILGQAAALATIQESPLFLSPVHAGFPSPADDFVETQLDLNQYLVSHPVATFFVRASGDSMEGAGIFNGDILVVDTSLQPRHGMVVVAVLNGEFTVKRFILQRKQVLLASENPAYPPIEIKDGMEFSVWGVVTYSFHRHSPHGL